MAIQILLVTETAEHENQLDKAMGSSGVACRARRAPSGRDAIAYLSGEGTYGNRELHPFPSLVFLDVRLPDVTGLEVLAWMHGRTECQRVLVVVLTNSRESVDVKRAYDLGAHSHLVKPVLEDEFAAMLRAVGSIRRS